MLTEWTAETVCSVDVEKAFDKIQHRFIIKILTKVRKEGTKLNILKAIYSRATIILNEVKWRAFAVNAGIRQGYPLSPLLFNTVSEVLATSIKQGKEKAFILEGKKENGHYLEMTW